MNNNTQSDGEKLLPCPFCSGDAHWIKSFEGEKFETFRIYCRVCKALSGEFYEKLDVDHKWNTRPANSSEAGKELEQENDVLLSSNEALARKLYLCESSLTLANQALSCAEEAIKIVIDNIGVPQPEYAAPITYSHGVLTGVLQRINKIKQKL